MQRLYSVGSKLLVLSALFIALGMAFPVVAQTTVTPAAGPGYTFCTGGNYAAIGTIQISENTANSFPVSGGLTYFRLSLPAGFVFNSSVTPAVTAPAGDFGTAPVFEGYFNGDSEIEISYEITGSVSADLISIAGLQVRATGVASGNITRVASTGPEADQPGNNIGDNISHGALTSANFTVSLSSSDPDNQVCAGQLVTFTATPTIVSGSNTYEFFKNGVSVQGPGTFPQYTSALNDNDEITVSATYTPNGCTNTITAGNGITTDVLPLPSVTAAAGPFTICGNDFADLTGTVFSNSSGVAWASSGDGSFQPNAFTVNAKYYPGPNDIVNGTVTLTITTTGSACTAASDNVTVTINPLPTPSITGLNAVCENQTNVIYSTPNVVGNTYSWSITGGTITAGAGTSSITVTWGAAGTGTLQLTETITASTCAVTTSVYNVTKNANPTPVISGPATVCAAQAANVYSTANVGGHSYSWTVSGGTITAGAGTASITVTWGSGASGTVQLTETITATGCATTTANYPVTINPLPTPSITGLNAVCENQTNVIYSTPNVVGNTYSWNITGGTITAGTGTSSITVTWGSAGTGTLQLTETITASTCAVTTAVYNVTKNANPTPVISGPATVCAAQAANVYSTTNVGGHSYSWTVSGGTITAGAGTSSITVTWGSGASGTVQLTETITA
ncbi:MAG: hypothetical protein JNJ75_08310, partial [Cyclobacteriaceae bacterium]|nr:hypothetical protein [Cyclobacteriaceae bacterium]